jgi:hypothetical protein
MHKVCLSKPIRNELFGFSGVLIKLYYRLSMPRNPNPRSDFPPSSHSSEIRPIGNGFFYFLAFRCFDETLLRPFLKEKVLHSENIWMNYSGIVLFLSIICES